MGGGKEDVSHADWGETRDPILVGAFYINLTILVSDFYISGGHPMQQVRKS